MNYYNENDPKAAAWLRQLIVAGLIPNGVVDDRSIEDVTPADLAGFTQCHFFAGIGGWSLALQLAGVAATTPLWTGSCPCQPFSTAGESNGFADERHLWPAWFWLIEQCQPAIIFGEQVASKAADPWFDLVQADLEAVGYAFGCVAFPAASVKAPHIRDRAYWMGHRSGARLEGFGQGHPAAVGHRQGSLRSIAAAGQLDGMAHGHGNGLDPQAGAGLPANTQLDAQSRSGDVRQWAGTDHGGWDAVDWLLCRDGRWRPVESGTFPLAHGVSERVVRLCGYGNAIVPQQAAAFVVAAAEVMAR